MFPEKLISAADLSAMQGEELPDLSARHTSGGVKHEEELISSANLSAMHTPGGIKQELGIFQILDRLEAVADNLHSRSVIFSNMSLK